MCQTGEMLRRGEELFNSFVEEVEKQRIGEISVRRALKKYDVKNLKINNITPLRAKKMYSSILPRYGNGVAADNSWLENERRLFVWCALCYLHKTQIQIQDLKTGDFQYLREMFPLKELDLVKFQIYSLIKKDSKICKWKDEEDNLLKSLVEKEKGKNIEWTNLSKQFFTCSSQAYFRNAKQCRQRWLNHLDPNKTKGKWEANQDRVLLNSVLEKGKKWSKIVQDLEGKKNEHMIKNRFKSLIHKKQKESQWKKLKQCDIIKLILKDIDQRKDQQGSEQSQKSDSEEQSQQQSRQESQNNVSVSMLEGQSKNNSNLVHQEKSSKWPIIVQPNNRKDTLKEDIIMQDQQRDNPFMRSEVEVEMCGSKVDKQFVNSLFFNVNTPVADERLQSINLETRSPANLFMSPFPGGCWTPTIFILDDTQGQLSPSMQLEDFSTTAKSTFHQFLPDENQKRN